MSRSHHNSGELAYMAFRCIECAAREYNWCTTNTGHWASQLHANRRRAAMSIVSQMGYDTDLIHAWNETQWLRKQIAELAERCSPILPGLTVEIRALSRAHMPEEVERA